MADFDAGMDYSEMENVADKIGHYAADFEKLTTNLKALASEVEGEWEGEAQEEFSKAFKSIEKGMPLIQKTLEQYVTTITQTVEGEKELKKKTAAWHNRLSF